jgi:hypothetical protein
MTLGCWNPIIYNILSNHFAWKLSEYLISKDVLVLYQILLVPITLACYLMLIKDTLWFPKHPTKWGVHILGCPLWPLSFIEHDCQWHQYFNTILLDLCATEGVQVLDPIIYNPPSNSNITFIMHMKFYRGPCHIINMLMYMQHKGAMYNTIIMNIINNPDGVLSKKKSC